MAGEPDESSRLCWKRRAFFELCRGLGRGDRPRRSGQAAARLLHWPDDAVRPQERGADGGGDGTGADGGAASIVAAFCRPGFMVGREGAGQGVRAGAAGDRAGWPDRGVDHRRHRLSEEGQALGRGGAAILRPVGQAGQLPGGGVAVDCQPPGQPAGALSALPAAGMGG